MARLVFLLLALFASSLVSAKRSFSSKLTLLKNDDSKIPETRFFTTFDNRKIPLKNTDFGDYVINLTVGTPGKVSYLFLLKNVFLAQKFQLLFQTQTSDFYVVSTKCTIDDCDGAFGYKKNKYDEK